MFSWQILLVLPLFISTALAGGESPVGRRDASPEPQGSLFTTTSPSASSTQSAASIDISSLVAYFSSEAAARTATKTVLVSLSSSLSTQASSTKTTATDSTSHATPTSPTSTSTSTSPSLSSTSSVSASTSSSSSIDSRTQTIILAVCFALLGLILLATTFFLFKRYRRRQAPFTPSSHRGNSPIDDDEIATWRGKTQPMAKTPTMHARNASSIVFQPSTGWGWNVSSSPATSPPPGSGGEALPYTSPPVVARAPNARSGLTDGAIPGAAPFVATPQRSSRRLSKSASTSQMRNKSRRSSVGASSIHDPPTPPSNGKWAEPEDWDVQRRRSNSRDRAAAAATTKTAMGRKSMGDDVRPDGLSPPGSAF